MKKFRVWIRNLCNGRSYGVSCYDVSANSDAEAKDEAFRLAVVDGKGRFNSYEVWHSEEIC